MKVPSGKSISDAIPYCLGTLPKIWVILLSWGPGPLLIFHYFLGLQIKLYFPVFLVIASQENFSRLSVVTGSKRSNDYFLKKSLSRSILLFCLLVTFGRLLFCSVLYSLIIYGLNTIYCIDFFLLKCFTFKELINIGAQSNKFENFYIYVMRDCPHLDT